jgi:hypothetical protein
MTETRSHSLQGILGQIARLTSNEAALEIGRHWGGRRLYIPREVHRGHPLVRIAGRKAAALLCASTLAGKRYDIPSVRAILHANEARRLYLEEKKGFTEIAVKLGISYRHTRQLLEGIERHEPTATGPMPAPAAALICPFCGHRFRTARAPDPRQMALPYRD